MTHEFGYIYLHSSGSEIFTLLTSLLCAVIWTCDGNRRPVLSAMGKRKWKSEVNDLSDGRKSVNDHTVYLGRWEAVINFWTNSNQFAELRAKDVSCCVWCTHTRFVKNQKLQIPYLPFTGEASRCIDFKAASRWSRSGRENPVEVSALSVDFPGMSCLSQDLKSWHSKRKVARQ